jgi:hypothetical protein
MEINMTERASVALRERFKRYNRADSYRFTTSWYSTDSIDALRKEIQIENAKARVKELETGIKTDRQRVVVRPRLGRNNPFRQLYQYGGPLHRYSSQDIRPEHGAYFDVYVHAVYAHNR